MLKPALFNHLFFRLLGSFIIIIVLLVSFNFLSFGFFKSHINEEIIQYNQLNLENTVGNYENQLESIRNATLNLYSDDMIQVLYAQTTRNNNDFNYYIANEIKKMFTRNKLSHSYLYLEDITLIFEHTPIVINKEGVYEWDRLFNTFQVSPAYNEDFWREQFAEGYTYKIFPADTFTRYSAQQKISSRTLIPLVVKNQFFEQMYFVALLDANRIFRDIHHSINDRFIMVNENGETIFTTISEEVPYVLPELDPKKTMVQQDDFYLFYQTGPSGITYINMIPNEEITSKVAQLNVVLISLLILAVFIGIGVSVLFSHRFNHPIKRMIESLQHTKLSAPFQTNIEEYKVINENLKDLHKNRSLLRYYAYSNKLKDIHSNFHDIQELVRTEDTFTLVLFELTFQPHIDRMEVEQSQAVNYVREFINVTLSELYSGSITFQVEKEQIISLIFAKDRDLRNTLNKMKEVFDLDKDYCFLTIAVSPDRKPISALTSTYEAVSSMIQQRIFNDETQIIMEKANIPELMITPNEEEEFLNHLLAGNDDTTIQWMHRQLAQIRKLGGYTIQYRSFAVRLTDKIERALQASNLDIGRIAIFKSELKRSHTATQFEQNLEYYLMTATELVKQKKEERDPITSFVIQYVENHYAEDISLDLLADKLNITRGYLSAYFKEKTGVKFSEYMNHFRMNKAKELLLNTDLRVQDVSEQVGYPNVNSFIRMFKKITGFTPGEYRKTA